MNKKSYILAIGMSILLIMLLITIIRGRPTGVASPSDFNLTPTAIPPDVLTRVAQNEAYISATQKALPTQYTQYTQAAQTEQALQLTLVAAPTTDMQVEYPIFSNILPRVEEILYSRPEEILAGYGILYEDQVSGVIHKYWPNGWVWQESTYDSVIWARGGYELESPTQGVIGVNIAPHYSYSPQNDVIIESPVQAGELTITGAIGERLIITSEQGQTFYFDVPALRFVDSLEEIVPTATLLPTMVFEPPFVPIDDVLDEPLYLDDFQLEDTNMNYYINSPGDYDWFAFVSQAEGTLKVSLMTQGKNYGLRVVLVDFDGIGTIVGEDLTSNSGTKQVILPNAARGNYIVRVWSLDGSYDESQPYTLRFDPPKPEKVIPILKCVAENADGTFIAHFGYENPNPYIIVIDSRHDNAFHPNPVFRTEQPEYFAPGRIENWFRVLFDGNDLTWRLEGLQVTANRNSPRCP